MYLVLEPLVLDFRRGRGQRGQELSEASLERASRPNPSRQVGERGMVSIREARDIEPCSGYTLL
jgi:hypothetical protein